MSRLLPRLLLCLGLMLGLAVGVFGWRTFDQRRDWAALRPPVPPAAGDTAPGLDARLQTLAARLQAWPPDRAALVEFTRVCHANGKLESAAAGYQALMQLDPGEPRWPYLLALIVAGYGELPQALPLFQRTTELAPNYVTAWLKLGDARLKSNAVAEAAAAYEEVLKRDRGNPYALLGLARCDLQSDRLTAARSRLQQAVTGRPDFVGAQSLLSMVHERLGNAEAAALARMRVQRSGHYTEAPDPWVEDLVFDSHDPYTLLTAAAAASVEDKPDRTLKLIERGLALTPDDPRLHRQLGRTLQKTGDLAGARRHLERAAALAPDNDAMQLDYIGLLHREDDHAGLERAVATGLKANPESAALRFEAGVLAAHAGRLDEAIEHLRFSWRISPDQVAAPIELANVYFRTGRHEEGVAILEEALAHLPHERAPLLLLIRHGIETGDRRTRGWLQRAVDGNPPAALLTDIRRDYQTRFGEPAP